MPGNFHATTVIMVKKDGKTVMAGDGQVTLGETVLKSNARKVRRLYNDKVLVGFAGATADALALLSRLESKLEECQGHLGKAVIELSKDWRTDRILRHLEALMIVADKESAFLVSGKGDVISPEEGLLAVGSGGMYALAAARALMKHTNLSARDIAEESLKIASSICIYTNSEIVVEEL
ncbi:MAG: ATP-dependent protease subunit HslV [Acidobacteria bacterium]|jgi:ATP-dependent HslUV protease subunit HslV|nr:MAG: ATP-dependent protease subunit HslV [Acidobacteriota bacterium]GIU81141.1 MAG: ATP-dependent protease subunit HslV [Pyrinomonadaceae bacterium]